MVTTYSNETGLRTFTIIVREEDQHLWTEVQELPGCFAAGRTFLELLKVLEEAIGQYLSDSDQPHEVRIVDVTGTMPAPETPDDVRSRQVAIRPAG